MLTSRAGQSHLSRVPRSELLIVLRSCCVGSRGRVLYVVPSCRWSIVSRWSVTVRRATTSPPLSLLVMVILVTLVRREVLPPLSRS